MIPRIVRRLAFTLLLGIGLGASAPAQEVQHHGVVFEKWIRDTFFDGYEPESYTQKWDIPAEANRRFGGLPVNPKATKYRTAVDLGDALRQFDIAERFILVVGFWEQDGDTKRFVNITPVTIHPETWRLLWGPVTRADLERLDAVVKDRTLDHREARRRAQDLKRESPFAECLLVLNPKIGAGAHGQRRLQCSLRFDHLFNLLASDASDAASADPKLWGVSFPGPIPSAARRFDNEPSDDDTAATDD